MIHVKVRPKTEFGVPKYGTVVHRILRIGGLLDDDNCVRLSATWLCGASAVNAVLLATPDSPGCSVCKRCAIGVPGILVYRCYDAYDRPLYIGYTSQYGNRMIAHEHASAWWPQVTRIEREEHPSVTAALFAERAAIEAERPLHNRQWVTA